MGHSVQLLRFDGAQPSRGKQGSKQNKEDKPEKMASFRAECCSPMMQAASKLERMILFCGLCTGPRAKSQHLRNVDHPSASFILPIFKPKKICAPVRPCTSAQDESPLPSPSSSGFCQQFLKNPRSWFHTGVDSRFRSDIPINNKDANRESSSSSSPSYLFSSFSSQPLFPQERRMRALTPTMGLSSPMARDSSR